MGVKHLTKIELFVWSGLMMVATESVAIGLRFGLGLESTRDTASTVGVLTHGVRIHHGYIGVLLLVLALAGWSRWPAPARWVLVAAFALIGSDLVHHFCVLWPVVGSPEFDLVY